MIYGIRRAQPLRGRRAPGRLRASKQRAPYLSLRDTLLVSPCKHRLRKASRLCAVAVGFLVDSALAAGNLPADAPEWDTIRDRLNMGQAPDRLGGVSWISRPTPQVRLEPADGGSKSELPDKEDPTSLRFGNTWVDLARRFSLRAAAADEHARPYSTPVHPRRLVGAVSLACEYQEGRPCGDGFGAFAELDSEAGIGQWLTLASRTRLFGGSPDWGRALDLDRAYVKLEAGPFALQGGRDVLVLGPGVRSALMLSRNAVPQDGARLQLRPTAIPLVPWFRISLFYAIERLRPPQRFPGTLLEVTRIQFEFGERVQIGGSRLLQFGGEGGPPVGGFMGYIREHFGRRVDGAEENNRMSGDISVRIPEWRATRMYYEIAFDDTRIPLTNMFRYDPDHLLGIEIRNVSPGMLRRLFFEFQKTSWDSQEHFTYSTGMSNAGRTLGSPIGPDAVSFWLRADFSIRGTWISPWAETLWFGSSLYETSDARGVYVARNGLSENRQRLGTDFRADIATSWYVDTGVFAERVGNFAFVPGTTRFNGGARFALVYSP